VPSGDLPGAHHDDRTPRVSRRRSAGERLARGDAPQRVLEAALAASRRGPFREDAFRSPLHDERVASVIGIALAASFTICFATGLFSHFIQNPLQIGALSQPASPAWLYRVTQGLHIVTGMAAIPLLLVKLWVVYPRLFAVPPVRSIAHAVERLLVAVLVGASLFILVTGVMTIAQWVPWQFRFRQTHFWTAWIVVGALVAHIGAKLPITRRVLGRAGRLRARAERRVAARATTAAAAATVMAAPATAAGAPTGPTAATGAASAAALTGATGAAPTFPAPRATGAMTRRGLVLTAFASAGVVVLTTAGETFRPLRNLALLAPRRPDVGPQGIPVNRTAKAAGVLDRAHAADWALVVDGHVAHPLRLTLDELRAMPQHEVDLPIACVEGWSASARWSGVAVRDLLARAGAPAGTRATVQSLERAGLRRSQLNPAEAAHEDTLLALSIDGEPLHPDHGFPCRLVGPDRPGVQQTKWVDHIEANA
jgi:DMSO/TMAO reductase YedYZ molybdopterin-dependent catalytic subunit